SSRRRHTRSYGDWSSDVCSSDLVFARTGFHDNFFLVAQWFPKPGVYEAAGERHRAQGGWNCHQLHTSTEFFADYGTFDVNLTVRSEERRVGKECRIRWAS